MSGPEAWGAVAETRTELWLDIRTNAPVWNVCDNLCAFCTGRHHVTADDRAYSIAQNYDGPDTSGLLRPFLDGWRTCLWCVVTVPETDMRYSTMRLALQREPTAEEFRSIRERALAFASKRGVSHPAAPFTILGLRLVRDVTTRQTRDLGVTP